MKVEATLFGQILIKLNELAELLGYQNLQIKSFYPNNQSDLEFWLVDGKTNEEFRIILPKIKE